MKVAVSMGVLSHDGVPLDYVPHAYVPLLILLGLTPVPVPNILPDPGAYIRALDVQGIVLTGGGDINPARYGQANTASKNIAPERDAAEMRLLETAVESNLPVLGIYRGFQVINVFFGGALVQDIPSQLENGVIHAASQHPIHLTDPRARLLGTDVLTVNSFHHQAVTAGQLAPGLEMFALSEADGVIEGVWHAQRPILGVQWHPERPDSAADFDCALIGALFKKGMFWA